MVSVWPPQLALPPLAARSFEMRVEPIPDSETRHRNPEVPPRITHQAFDLALIVPLRETARLIGPRALPLGSAKDREASAQL